MMFILLISLLTSFLYWYIANKVNENDYQILKMLLKVTSLITLIIYGNEVHPMNYLILMFYLLGDIVIVWNELLCIPFFILGHYLYIASYLLEYPNTFLTGLMITPILLFISLIVYMILGEPDIVYFIYTYALLIILIIGIASSYYGYLLMILSDIIIISRIQQVQPLSWPLYYISIYIFIYYS